MADLNHRFLHLSNAKSPAAIEALMPDRITSDDIKPQAAIAQVPGRLRSHGEKAHGVGYHPTDRITATSE